MVSHNKLKSHGQYDKVDTKTMRSKIAKSLRWQAKADFTISEEAELLNSVADLLDELNDESDGQFNA